jgi:hypothetical protein
MCLVRLFRPKKQAEGLSLGQEELRIPLPPVCWDYTYVPPCLAYLSLILRQSFSSLLKCEVAKFGS